MKNIMEQIQDAWQVCNERGTSHDWVVLGMALLKLSDHFNSCESSDAANGAEFLAEIAHLRAGMEEWRAE
jgi:hypothetical protein